MERLRISAISYLNTAPLMWDFQHGTEGADFDISYTIPSQCAAALKAGSADIGIIPAASYTTIHGLVILPGVAIASIRAVRSILLVSKVPLAQIRSVALDTSSMTSVALTKVLFSKLWGGQREFAPMAPNIEKMLEKHDAGLLIGDPALKIDRSRYVTYDLAEEWIQLTGKPFVFAFWALRQAVAKDFDRTAGLAEIFQQSRNHGLLPDSLSYIAKHWAPKVGLTEIEVHDYLTRSIHYEFDANCLQGMNLFFQYAAECGALPPAPELNFLQGSPLAVL
jgi:chorismate dehydratase